MRSPGITPQEFVKQVYYVQEGVLLDFWPTDDKYKEVIVEANLQLQKLQETEDWSWLRERRVLGHCGGRHEIPEFQLPHDVYKPAQGHKDAVRLHYVGCDGANCGEGHCARCPRYHQALTNPALQAHWMSQSSVNNYIEDMQGFMYTQVLNTELKATWTGQNIITFNRKLNRRERLCVAETDVIIRMPSLHVCDDTCENAKDVDAPYEQDIPTPCPKIEKNIFGYIPDINYMVYATAAAHGIYSPPAALAVAKAQEEMKTILSAMRQNDAMKTTPDVIKRSYQRFLTVV